MGRVYAHLFLSGASEAARQTLKIFANIITTIFPGIVYSFA